MSAKKQFNLHLISDATGETINHVARACVIQFDQIEPVLHYWNLVRTPQQLEITLDRIRDDRGIVMFTLVNDNLRRRLQEFCRENQIPCISVLDPLINALSTFLGLKAHGQPGLQHNLSQEYFERIEAVEYTLAHDDGQATWDLHGADVILVGVSRSSKTPTCIYLANRGIKAANIPFVPNCPLPEELEQLTRPLIVGLTKEAESLVQIRRNRLRLLKQNDTTTYVNHEDVRSEIAQARRLFSRHGWPVIDVTRRSIEETAAEIMALLSQRNAERA